MLCVCAIALCAIFVTIVVIGSVLSNACVPVQVEIPIVIVGSLSKSANHLTWESPLFRGEVEKGFSEKAVIETREGNPALNALIGFITTIELSPDDVREKANLRWPTVRGPHGSFA